MRKPREKSKSGIYHVVLRGVNKKQVFYDDQDCMKYISLLKRYKKECGYKIFAYCLMGNHLHLLIQEGEVSLGNIFKRIGPAFSYWYHKKYKSCGHIFQGRFLSEPVDSQEYFQTVLRYILRNPVKAKLCATIIDYKYSNARALLCNLPTFTDTKVLFTYIGQNQLRELLSITNDDNCLELNETIPTGVTDETAIELILQEFGTLSPNVGSINSEERKVFTTSIKKLKEKELGIRQLSRLTGIPRAVIRTA